MKKLLVIGICAIAALASSADVLYWMVDNDYENRSDAVPSTGADLYAVYTGQAATSLDHRDNSEISEALAWGDNFEVDLGSSWGDGWSYYVEYSNGIKTNPMDYSTALSNGYIAKGGSLSTPNLLSNGAFGSNPATYNVPEPTSGLLFLVGGMLLGLKRRRQQV